MAGKRAATSDLNHDNWDEAEQAEESGVFRTASKEELQRRVIRTGRRRVQPGSATQDQKSVFSGFSGFNKAPTSSFDFLSNLTNGRGSVAPNGTSAEKKDSGSPTGMFGSPVASSTALFSTSPGASSGPKPGSLFGINQTPGESKSTSIFGVTTTTTVSTTSTPTMTFGIPQKSSIPTTSGSKPASVFGTPSQSSSMFDSPSKSTTLTNKVQSAVPMFSAQSQGVASSVSKPAISQMPAFKMPSTSTPLVTTGSMFNTGTNVKSGFNVTSEATKKNNSADQGKIDKVQYYSKIKALNESVSDWIKQNVNDNPLCILTPIFRDYERYLKEIEEEHYSDAEKINDDDKTALSSEEMKNCLDEKKKKSDSNLSTPSFLPSATSTAPFATKPSPGFSLSTASPSAPFSFGINTASPPTISSTAPPISTVTPFSFGIGKGFNVNTNQTPQEQAEDKKEDEDEPPKVEFTPIAEENSVFDKRCKIFFKKDNNFVDKGVGTLYIKTIPNSNKHQLIVRANTSLGTVLLNFILSESIPTQRMGKNNVMVVCIPTPDSKPPPIPVLIRVKSGEEADEILETLNRYKS